MEISLVLKHYAKSSLDMPVIFQFGVAFTIYPIYELDGNVALLRSGAAR